MTQKPIVSNAPVQDDAEPVKVSTELIPSGTLLSFNTTYSPFSEDTHPAADDQTYAAIDLGSNSFHMAVARPEGRAIRLIDSLRTPVRLGAGLDSKKRITTKTEKLALDTLRQFAERVREIPRANIRVVGTNTLRRARNSSKFADKAYDILGKRIEIISGREEARLIFESVAYTQPDHNVGRLVMDIGGGSTELITGTGTTPVLMESVNMGCVSFTKRWFSEGKLTSEKFRKATLEAQQELQPVALSFTQAGWDTVFGCSGTIKATARILHELDLESSDGEISWSSLKSLQKLMIKAGDIEKLKLESISKDRAQVIAGGICILMGIMKILGVKHMSVSQVALREGLIFEMIGKSRHTDIRSHTINNIAKRFQVDMAQATRVEDFAMKLFFLASNPWQLDSEEDANLLRWAARVHEIGFSVAHTQYHKHGAYLLSNADMMGFTQSEQTALSLMVRFHRRKFEIDPFDELPKSEREGLLKLTALLRLSVLINRSRNDAEHAITRYSFDSEQIKLHVDDEWLEQHPLTTANIEDEADRLENAGFELKLVSG